MHDSEGGAHARLPRRRMRRLHSSTADLLDQAELARVGGDLRS